MIRTSIIAGAACVLLAASVAAGQVQQQHEQLQACALPVGSPPVTKFFQKGVSPGRASETLSCVIDPPPAGSTYGIGGVTEGPTMDVNTGNRGLLAFASAIGPGANQVPPKRQIVSATLTLTVTAVPAGATSGTITLGAIETLPPAVPWKEPEQNVVQEDLQGVSWFFRDDRTFPLLQLWGLQGGDIVPTILITHNYTVGTVPFKINIPVTQVVRHWLQGNSNHGFIFNADTDQGGTTTFAADDFATANDRPRLSVTLCGNNITGGNITPWVPNRNAGTVNQGDSVVFNLTATDGDGETIEYDLRDVPPGKATLIGNKLAFQPDGSLTGAQSVEHYGSDASSVSRLAYANVVYSADPSITSVAFSGNGKASSFESGLLNLRIIDQDTDGSNRLLVQREQWTALVEEGGIFGDGVSQVPVGAEIVSAFLDLTVYQAPSTEQVVVAQRVIDPNGDGPWVEAQVSGSFNGATMLYRDAEGIVPWVTPGGDVTPAGASTVAVDSLDNGLTVSIDVTEIVQQWSSGAPNQGVRLTGISKDDLLRFGSDEDTNPPVWRISYRATGGANNGPPHAEAGGDQTATAGVTVTLDGSGSYDPEGDPITITWTQVSGTAVTLTPAGTGVVTFTAPTLTADETLEFMAEVVASNGGTDIDAAQVTVLAAPGGVANLPPTADAGPDQSGVNHGDTVFLDATGSSDPEGNLFVLWQQIDGVLPAVTLQNPTSLTPSFVANVTIPLGTSVDLTFMVLAYDEQLQYSTDTVVVNVTRTTNQPPVAAAGANQAVKADQWVGLDFRQSSDPDNDPITYQVTNVSGPVTLSSLTDPVVYFRAPHINPGTPLATFVTVTLQVTDFYGATDTDTVSVTVTSDPLSFTGASTSVQPYHESLTPAEARHFWERAVFGATPDRVTEIMTNGLTATVDTLIAQAQGPTDPTLKAAAKALVGVTAPPCTGSSYEDAIDNVFFGSEYMLYFMASDDVHPLKSKMLYFWHDRAATAFRNIKNDDTQDHFILEHIELLLDHACSGDLRDLFFRLTDTDGGMNIWLDGAINTGSSPNENYARELMELFTLGLVDPVTGVQNYTETDIQQAALALSGYKFVDDTSCGDWEYVDFDPARHYSGSDLVIFGLPQAAYMPLDFVGLIFDDNVRGQSARRYFCKNIFEYFCGFSPTTQQIEDLRTTMVNGSSHGWDIAPVIRQVLRSRAFFSPQARSVQVKPPLEHALVAVRTLGLEINDPGAGVDGIPLGSFANALIDLDHYMTNPPAVNGWPEDTAWVSLAASLDRRGLVDDILSPYNDGSPLPSSLDVFDPTVPGLDDAASLMARAIDILNIDKDEVDPPTFNAWMDYMNTVLGGTGQPVTAFYSGSAKKKLGGLYLVLAGAFEQAK